ncbi:MAG: diacylglycerol kinase family lipid kinase [Anaerolineae bacterium]|nr:MAG: diacylglycerol kinase family lipid kinase [Anaerolineae bacterium]
MDAQDAMLIFNPAAGARDVRREVGQVVAFLERQRWQVDLRETRGPADATAFARQAVELGKGAVLVVGGDGTINEVVNGLVGSEVVVGLLPAGTGNVWAMEMCLPIPGPIRWHTLLDATRSLVQGEVRPIDLGRVNGRYFLLWGGIGLDAQVTQRMEPRTRTTKRLGALAYGVTAFLVAKDFLGTRTRVVADGLKIRTRSMLIIISNAQLYARIARVASRAYLDDGLLDVCVFKGSGLPMTLLHVIHILTERHLQDPRVAYIQARQVTIETRRPLLVQVDGDPIGTTPVTFEAVPRALRIIVPPEVPPWLFVGGGERPARFQWDFSWPSGARFYARARHLANRVMGRDGEGKSSR